MLRLFALIDTALLQHVVGHEGHRHLGEDLLRQVLAADPLLQQVERRGSFAVGQPDQDLTVEHRPIRPRLRHGHDLRESVGHQLLAARPDPHLPSAAHHLRADAVVLPLNQPVAGRAEHRFEIGQRHIDRVREEERIRLPGIQPRQTVLRHQPRKTCSIRPGRLVGVAHHALRHRLGIEPSPLGQRALHQQLADADAKATADQLGQQESLVGVEFVPVLRNARRLRLRRIATQGQQALLDPNGEADIAALRSRRQHMSDRLGQIADSLIALLEQPVIDAGTLTGERSQHPRRHRLTRFSSRQEVHRPGRIGRLSNGEVALQCIDLGRGGRAGIEFRIERGKAPQFGTPAGSVSGVSGSDAASTGNGGGSPASSCPNSVLNDPVCSPCCASHRTITAS